MAVTDLTVSTVEEGASTAVSGVERVLVATDAKVIGRLFIGSSLLLLAVTLIGRAIAAAGGQTPVLGDWTSGIQSSSQFGSVTLGVAALGLGLAMYIAPLQIGSRGFAFPRAAAFSFWLWLMSAALFFVSVANDGGLGGRSDEMSRLGMIAFGGQLVALAVGYTMVFTTIFTMRARGMTITMVPMFTFASLIAAALWVVTIGVALSKLILAYVPHDGAAALRSGLLPSLDFLAVGPTAALIALPALGAIGDVLIAASGKALRSPAIMQTALGLFGLGTLGMWVNDTAASVNSPVWSLCAFAAMFGALIFMTGVGSHIQRSEAGVSAPTAFAALGALLIELGAVLGAIGAVNSWGAPDVLGFPVVNGFITIAQPGVLLAGSLLGLTAGLYHWSPKLFGGGIRQATGLPVALIAALGGVLLGISGGLNAYGLDAHSNLLNPAAWVAVAGFGLLALAALAVLGLIASGGAGNDEARHGFTLEWLAASPPATDNFDGELQAVTSTAPLLDDEFAASSAPAAEEGQ